MIQAKIRLYRADEKFIRAYCQKRCWTLSGFVRRAVFNLLQELQEEEKKNGPNASI